jgi:hypothetical protein
MARTGEQNAGFYGESRNFRRFSKGGHINVVF